MSTCYNPFSLEGKTILVTGASSGIGKATAIECSKLGADLVITGRNQERLNDTLAQLQPGNHLAIPADLSDAEALKEFVSELPNLDGMALCAGISDVVPVQFATRKKFDKVFETNFFAVVELIRLVVKGKKLNPGGSLVIISSISGNYETTFGNGIYGASKGALSSWCKFLAQEYASKKIRVNTICPGMVNTPLISGGAISDEQLIEDAKKYPLKRYGEPSEIAWACIYFLSDASAWVTGTNFIIDGGTTL